MSELGYPARYPVLHHSLYPKIRKSPSIMPLDAGAHHREVEAEHWPLVPTLVSKLKGKAFGIRTPEYPGGLTRSWGRLSRVSCLQHQAFWKASAGRQGSEQIRWPGERNGGGGSGATPHQLWGLEGLPRTE